MEDRDLRGIVRALIEARIRETDITDGTRVPFGSPEHVTDLEMRISDLERWRDRQRRGSEARANYARLISALKRELRSAIRMSEPRPAAPLLDPSMMEADGPKKGKKRRVKCKECGKTGYVSRAWTDSSEPYYCAKCDDKQIHKDNKPINEAVDMSDPEYASIESFSQFLLDDEREEYTHEDLAALNFRTRMPIAMIRKELDSYGFKLAGRAPEKQVRGFTSNSHDRWHGKGSLPTHGGAGINPQTGRAD